MRQKAIEGADLSKLQRFPLEGYVIRVIDGDTIELRGRDSVVVRLAGIDAPETSRPGSYGQTGSAGAISYLTALITTYRSALELYIDPQAKTHGRLVGVLVVGKLNVNLALVRRGLVTTYAPQEGAGAGIQMKQFRRAEQQALAARRGLFSLAEYRAQVALNRARGDVANVQLASPERQAQSFSARVRAGAIAGLRQADHSANVPHAIQGMNPNRLDFGGSRTPFNPVSESVIQGMLKSDYGSWREAITFLEQQARGTGGFMFADIETTGLRATDPVIEAAFSRVGPGMTRHYNLAIVPELPMTGDIGSLAGAMAAGYESPLNEQYRKQLMYPGSYVSSVIPDESITRFLPGQVGRPITLDQLRSTMTAPFAAAQLEHINKIGQTARMGDVLQEMFGSPSKRSFMFIQNPRFEASRWAPHIKDTQFTQWLRSGSLAAGDPNYKSVFQSFDTTLSELSSRAFEAERMGASGATHRAEWYKRLRSLMKSGTGRGVAVVDIQDLTRSVFGMASLIDPSISGATSGMLSQDFLARMFGLSKESHLALGDTAQSQIIAAKLLQMGDEFSEALTKGATPGGSRGLGLIRKASKTQNVMALFSTFKDVVNRVEEAQRSGVPVDKITATWKGQEIRELKRAGQSYFIDGTEIPGNLAPKVFYAGGDSTELSLGNYTARRLRMQFPSMSSDEAQQLAGQMVKASGSVNLAKMTQGDVYQAVTGGFGKPVDQLDFVNRPLEFLGARLGHPETKPTDVLPSRQWGYLARQLQVPAAVKPTTTGPVSAKQVADAVGRDIKGLPELGKELWTRLSPRNRKIAGGVGIALAALGVLGSLRSIAEEERQAQPESVDIEQYFADQQAVDALQFMQPIQMDAMMEAAGHTSRSLLQQKKDPGRYYPTRG